LTDPERFPVSLNTSTTRAWNQGAKVLMMCASERNGQYFKSKKVTTVADLQASDSGPARAPLCRLWEPAW